MNRPTAVALLALLALLLLAMMWWGWQRRARRTAVGLAPLPQPWDAGEQPRVPGVYVSSTTAGEWLDRIAAAGLGVRSPVEVAVDSRGVLLLRRGAPDVAIPAADLVNVRRERGIAGKVADAGGLVVVRWRLGEVELDTGIRTRYQADRDPLVARISALLPQAYPTSEPPAKDDDA